MFRKIIPVILADDIKDFKEKHEVISSFSDEIQIDIVDGEFVDNKTVTLEEINELDEDKIYEAHLMVKNPLEYLGECRRLGIKRIAFHSEIEGDLEKIIDKIKDQGFEIVLAINPETNIADMDMYAKKINRVLLLSVEPGFGGQKMISGVLDKAKKLREKYEDLIIEIDGGVNVNNIGEVFSSGVNVACIGSGILKAKNPREAWERLKKFE